MLSRERIDKKNFPRKVFVKYKTSVIHKETSLKFCSTVRIISIKNCYFQTPLSFISAMIDFYLLI